MEISGLDIQHNFILLSPNPMAKDGLLSFLRWFKKTKGRTSTSSPSIDWNSVPTAKPALSLRNSENETVAGSLNGQLPPSFQQPPLTRQPSPSVQQPPPSPVQNLPLHTSPVSTAGNYAQSAPGERQPSEIVSVDCPSRYVHQYIHDKDLYYAYEDTMPLPDLVRRRWEWQQGELKSNLEPVAVELSCDFSNAFFETPYLCFSGRRNGNRVTLFVTVWILCSDDAVRDRLRTRMAELLKISRIEYQFEVQTGVSRWSGGSADGERMIPVDPASSWPIMVLDSKTKLYAHAQFRVHGVMLCLSAVADDHIVWQRFSVAGGTLSVGGLEYLVTTAHCMLRDLYNDASSSKANVPAQHNSPMTNVAEPRGLHVSSCVDPFKDYTYTPLDYRGPMNFLGAGTTGHGIALAGPQDRVKHDSGTPFPASDFALLAGNKALEKWRTPNTYCTGSEKIHITRLATEEQVEAGEVYVLFAGTSAKCGYLLSQRSGIVTPGASLETYKVKLDVCLSKFFPLFFILSSTTTRPTTNLACSSQNRDVRDPGSSAATP